MYQDSAILFSVFFPKRSRLQIIGDPEKTTFLICNVPTISKHWPSWFFDTRPSQIFIFENPKITFINAKCFQYYVQYYQISISCFLADIDLISKISMNLLNGSTGLFGARLSQHFEKFGCSRGWDLWKLCEHDLSLSLISWGLLGSLKIKKQFWEPGTRPKVEKSWHLEFWASLK